MTQLPLGNEFYTHFLIRIHPWDAANACYLTEAQVNSSDPFTAGQFRPDADALRAAEPDPAHYGKLLFETLFQGKIRQAYDVAIGMARATTEGRLRIRLWIDDGAAALHALLWERLRDPQSVSPLAVSGGTLLSRYIGLEGQSSVTPPEASPLRMAFVIANPVDLGAYNLAALDVEAEVGNLLDAASAATGVKPELTVFPGRTGLSPGLQARVAAASGRVESGPTTLETLLRLLDNAAAPHILHILAHGAFNRRTQTAALYLEDALGNVQTTTDGAIAVKIHALRPLPHLIFLAACESAKRDPGNSNPFVGLSPKLVQAGVPAVVAMQDTLLISTARTLTYDFYRQVWAHGVVDRALSQARLVLYGAPCADWATPVLLMRIQDGRLFTPVIERPPNKLETISEEQRLMEDNVAETLALLREYEEQRRLTNDPKTRRSAEKEIQRLRTDLARYRAELRDLG